MLRVSSNIVASLEQSKQAGSQSMSRFGFISIRLWLPIRCCQTLPGRDEMPVVRNAP